MAASTAGGSKFESGYKGRAHRIKMSKLTAAYDRKFATCAATEICRVAGDELITGSRVIIC